MCSNLSRGIDFMPEAIDTTEEISYMAVSTSRHEVKLSASRNAEYLGTKQGMYVR